MTCNNRTHQAPQVFPEHVETQAVSELTFRVVHIVHFRSVNHNSSTMASAFNWLAAHNWLSQLSRQFFCYEIIFKNSCIVISNRER